MKAATLLKATLTVVVVALIANYFFVHQEELAPLARLSIRELAALTGLIALTNLIYSEKLLILLRAVGLTRIARDAWLEIFLISRFLNLHLTQAGLIYRSTRLKRDYGFTYTRSLSTTGFLTWTEALTVVSGGFVALMWFPDSARLELWLAALLAMLAAGPWMLQRLVRLLPTGSGWWEWIRKRLEQVGQHIYEGLALRAVLARVMLLNVCMFAVQLAWIWLCLRAFGIDTDPRAVVLYVLAMQLSGMIRVVPGNLGITEVATGFAAQLTGDGFAVGVLLSLVQRICVYLFFGITALLWVPGRAVARAFERRPAP